MPAVFQEIAHQKLGLGNGVDWVRHELERIQDLRPFFKEHSSNFSGHPFVGDFSPTSWRGRDCPSYDGTFSAADLKYLPQKFLL